jgi:LacI family transcriptional regulator
MSKRGSKRVGIKDIALQAGVSIGTVDRVLHNRGDVKDETRRRVMGIVDKLGYSPNLIAKTLSSKKLTRISIVIPESSDSNPYWGKPIIGIKLAIEELTSFNTEIEYKTFDLSDEQSYINALQNVYNENPDGVVLNPVFKSASNNFIKLFDERNIPYVFIDINLKDANNLAYFGLNAMESGRVAARLMDLSSPKSPTYLLVKQANKKVFSHHIENRIAACISLY